ALTLCRLHSFLERPSFESVAVRPVMVADGISKSRVALHNSVRDFDSLVRRIIEHLDIKLLPRILHLADGIDQAVDHELLIENWKLNCNSRQFGKMGGGLFYLVLAMLVVKIDKHIPVNAI